MDIKPIINNTAHKKALKALAALFALLSFIGGLVVIVSRAKLVSGMSDVSSSSLMRDPTGAMGLIGSLDAFLDGGAMTKIMSILCFAFSGIAFLVSFKTKDKVIFSAIGCGAALVQFVMALIISPISLKGLINSAMKSALSGDGSVSLGTPLAILIILIIMAAIVCFANILGIAVKMDDAQLINRFKQSSQPQYPQQMMGYPQYQQPMQPQYQQPNMMGQPMQPQYQQPMQQPVPQAQPQYQQPVDPQAQHPRQAQATPPEKRA
ncbi:MAG: hypothetical protein K2N56_11785, partial [Oscillospiraceae bacterium]|nr:hypothetical protein [Oscillospiraceae bacterium]